MLRRLLPLISGLAALTACASAPDTVPDPQPALPGEIVYRVLIDRFDNADPANDRGGIVGGRLDHGFDQARPHFYHGGDLAGVARRIPYIENLGATAIQLSPLFANRPVVGPRGQERASFHGEWLADLTRLDPHLGTMADLRALTDAARDRGIKIYVDVVLNGTSDLIAYEGCDDSACDYRNIATYPYTTRGDAFAGAINPGFERGAFVDHRALTDPRWAFVPRGPEADARAPSWLQDPTHYHQRGHTTPGAMGEARRNGDWPGQDDLFTEHPVVSGGLIAAYRCLIDEGGVDGFRILDADGLNAAFLTDFEDAMARAAAAQGRDFFVWGEVTATSAAALARFVRDGGLPLVADAGFENAVGAFVSGGSAREFARVFGADALHAQAGIRLPTAISSFEKARLAGAVRLEMPDIGDDELFDRVRLGAVLLLTGRGTPVLYMGDEQGFGGTADATAQDMFANRTSPYRGEDLIGTNRTAADDNFDPSHAYYRFIAELTKLRRALPELSRGEHIVRLAPDGPGLFVFSRTLGIGEEGAEVVIAVNTSNARQEGFAPVGPHADTFEALAGYCASGTAARGSYPISVPARSFVMCRSAWAPDTAP